MRPSHGTRRARRAASVGIWAALLAAGLATGPSGAPAQENGASSWSVEKCRRYAIAWSELLGRRGRRNLGQDFVDRHDRFIASGCTARGDVCPRSAEEFEVANMMTIAAMNAGTASTFLPFACPR